MQLHSTKIYEKSFSDEISKKAYLKACKWLAVHVYSSPINEYITVKITKQEKYESTFLVELFVSIDELKQKREFCMQCQKLHSVFYSIDKVDCNKCKLNAYFKQREQNSKNVTDFCKNIILKGEEQNAED